MSNADQVTLAYRSESAFAEDPSTPDGALTYLRFISENIKGSTAYTSSSDITADRQITNHVRTDFDAGGPMRFEFHHNGYNPFLLGALQAASWDAQAAVISTDTNVSYTHSSRTFTLGSGTWDVTPTAGRWVLVAGFAGANTVLNGIYEVSGTPTTTTFVAAQGNDTASGDVSAGDSVTITQLARGVNGTTKSNHLIEKEWTDLTNKFAWEKGCNVDTLSLSVSREGDGKVSGEFGFLAGDEEFSSSSAYSSSATAANTFPGLSAAGIGTCQLLENDALLSFRSVDFSISNNLRARKNAGSSAADSIGSGKFNVSATVRMYQTDANTAIATRWKAGTASGLAVIVGDTSGNFDVIHIPTTTYSDVDRGTPGENQDIFLSVPLLGSKDSTLGHTMSWNRYTAP